MKANGLLKWLVPAVLLGIVLIIIKSWVTAPDGQPTHDPENATLSAEQAKALGIAGDTLRDTVATLIGQVKAMRSEMQTLKKGNDTLQTENNRLRTREGNTDTRIQSTLSSVTQQVTEQRQQANDARQKAEQQHRETQGLLSRLKDQLTGKPAAKSDVPAGFGLEQGDEQQLAGAQAPADAVQWIEPSNARAGQEDTDKADGPLSSLTSKFKDLHALDNNAIDRGQDRLRAVAKGERDLENAQDRTEGARPVYTIPENSTLMGSIAMTALIGRVPVDGTVNDPYPFKVLVGPDNLTANGIDLPDVVGAVMSGLPPVTGRCPACAARSSRSPSSSATVPSARCRSRRRSSAAIAVVIKPRTPRRSAAAWATSPTRTAFRAFPASAAQRPAVPGQPEPDHRSRRRLCRGLGQRADQHLIHQFGQRQPGPVPEQRQQRAQLSDQRGHWRHS